MKRPRAVHGVGRYHQSVLTTDSPAPATPYPEPPLLSAWELTVDGGHVLSVQEYGSADGIAALLLHGGPGSRCTPLLRRGFDPARYRMICMDQRGAGASQPRGGTTHNTTADLLADLQRLRRHLGLQRWLVVGGSWGATLALAYAAQEPEAVDALLLRASFLARREDVEWFFQGARVARPLAWQRLAAEAPPERRHALLGWLTDCLHGTDAALQARAAHAWSAWEQAASSADSAAPHGPMPQGDTMAALTAKFRVQSHYLQHGCWFDDMPLLERCGAVPRVPTRLLHARDDIVCRPQGAQALQARLPHAQLQWLDAGGHDAAHPLMVAAMTAALGSYAADGHFGETP
jgi:proline iminopeptidase